MKILLTVILALSLTNICFAQSLKERLREAREAEAMDKQGVNVTKSSDNMTTTTPPSVTGNAPSVANNVPLDAACDVTPRNANGNTYYKECYCKSLTYPEIGNILQPYGLTFSPVGIKELNEDGVTHNDPAERVNYFYTCGIVVDWGDLNNVKFSSVQECFSFVEKVRMALRGKVFAYTSSLTYDCGNRVSK